MDDRPPQLINREVSWLSFNYRVLQEAKDTRVPLFDRIKFLAIYSSNLDEFFRVRVASIRSLLRLGKRAAKKIGMEPEELLEEIHAIVDRQQSEFGEIFRNGIIPALARHGILFPNDAEVNEEQAHFLSDWFDHHVAQHLYPVFPDNVDNPPFLRNRGLYLFVMLGPKEERGAEGNRFALLEIPAVKAGRFVTVPDSEGKHVIMFLDDVLRCNLHKLFPDHTPLASWSVKLTRDAELYIDDEFSGDLLEKIKKSLGNRETGVPSRFLYDEEMPEEVLRILQVWLGLSEEDLVQGGRYHNFNDLFTLPLPDFGELKEEGFPPLPHPILEQADSLFDIVRERDVLLTYPYQSYNYVVRFLQEAVRDPAVRSISLTLYRAASRSKILEALIEAVCAGKTVTAFVEVKARFDEEANFRWAQRMEAAGVRVFYSFPGMKVHAKLCLIGREESGVMRQYAYMSTGNFNEKTATLYTDYGLFTADERLTGEVATVFDILERDRGAHPKSLEEQPQFRHLLVAPFTLRKGLCELIDNEIRVAQEGGEGAIDVKMNSLEDPEMIEKLYEASRVGVRIRMIVRGICCLLPGVEGLSENIRARSILDRFLEHSRIFFFRNSGEERCYIGSADWMIRNLSRRIEVVLPIYDQSIREELRDIFEIQWGDTCKGRILDAEQRNGYGEEKGREEVRSQKAIYSYLREKYISESEGAP